jgi:hypothetical protein
MTLSMFVKGKVDFRQLWVCLSKEKLTLDMTKCVFECDDEKIELKCNEIQIFYNSFKFIFISLRFASLFNEIK